MNELQNKLLIGQQMLNTEEIHKIKQDQCETQKNSKWSALDKKRYLSRRNPRTFHSLQFNGQSDLQDFDATLKRPLKGYFMTLNGNSVAINCY